MKWSYSMDQLFRRCQRRSFFSAIMARYPGSDPLRREAAFLKKLRNVQAWQGQLVHDYIKSLGSTLRKSQQLPPLTKVSEDIRTRAAEEFQFSAQKLYRGRENGRFLLALFEHEYERTLKEGTLAQVQSDTSKAVETFLSREKLIGRLKRPETRTEFLVKSPMGSDLLQSRLDIFFPLEKGLCIVDLKVEQIERDHRMQLQVYAYLILQQPGYTNFNPEAVELYDWNLLSGRQTRYQFTAESYSETEDFIFSSLRDIRRVAPDQIYKPEIIDNFAYTENPRNCEFCPFQRLCRRLSNGHSFDNSVPDLESKESQMQLSGVYN